jgi:hypothetical protein
MNILKHILSGHKQETVSPEDKTDHSGYTKIRVSLTTQLEIPNSEVEGLSLKDVIESRSSELNLEGALDSISISVDGKTVDRNDLIIPGATYKVTIPLGAKG